MTDIASTARTARESLARGLSALQSDPNMPPQLLELAGTIAQAMGALHQIERSNGAALSPHAGIALNNVRTALSQLQAAPTHIPSVAQAMEAVAGALGMVHALSKLAPEGAPAPQPAQPAFPATQPALQQVQPPQAPPQQQWQQPPQQAASPYGPPPQPQQPAYAAPPQQQAPNPYAAPQGDPFAAPNRSPMAATALAPSGQAGPAYSSQAPGAPPAPAGDVPVVTADLGAHSPTNFYKGLSGNDVIDHGGLFVSTYMIPKLGQTVRLRVSLPGGYEFEANALVKWRREQGGDAPPGFGAQFTQITQEARQLVYRYVRNREPLFYDEL